LFGIFESYKGIIKIVKTWIKNKLFLPKSLMMVECKNYILTFSKYSFII